MTNPHIADKTDIDIRASADRVIKGLQQGRQAEALRLLEQERQGERPVVQEALDRYVAAGALHVTRLPECGERNFPSMPRRWNVLAMRWRRPGCRRSASARIRPCPMS